MDHRRSQKLSLMLLVFCSFLFSSVVNAAEQQKLIIANSKAWKPYSYIDDQGKPSGILIDFWLAFGQVNNVDIEFKLMDWNDSLEAVKYGKADIQAGLIRSPSREKYLDFGEPLLEIDTQLYVHQRFLGENWGSCWLVIWMSPLASLREVLNKNLLKSISRTSR